MPLEGEIVASDVGVLVPTGSWYLKGEDGKHYIGSVNGTPTIGCAEDNSVAFTISLSKWETDFNAIKPVTVPTANISTIDNITPIPYTPYFYILAEVGTIIPNDLWVCAVRYKITDNTTLEVDGGFAFKAPYPSAGVSTCWVFGANVVDSQLFIVAWLANNYSGDPGHNYLLKLPLNYGEFVLDAAANAWAARRTQLPFRGGGSSTNYFTDTDTHGGNKCNIFKYPDINNEKVMVLTYRPAFSVPDAPETNLTSAGSEYTLVNHVAQTHTGLNNGQIALGLEQPWDDIGFDSNGDPGTIFNRYNDYTAPTISPNGTEVIFARGFTDNGIPRRARRFTYDDTTGLFTPVDILNFELLNGDPLDQTTMLVRDGDNLLGISGIFGGDSNWALTEFELPEPLEPGEPDAVGGAGAQMEPIGVVLELNPYTAGWPAPLNSCIELGPFRFAEQRQADETAAISSLILGISQQAIGIIVEEDWNTSTDADEDWNDEVDQDGDDIYEDWSEGSGDSDDFTLQLRSTDDGISAQFQGDETLDVIEDFGSSKQYSPIGYSAIYHRLHICAREVDEYWAVKTIDIAGVLTGRHL